MADTTTPLETPDITPVQQLAAAGLVALGALIALVNAFEWADVSGEQAAAITGVYAAFASFAVLADAIIRNGRSRSLLHQPKGLIADDTEVRSSRRAGG